jgi:chromosome segregation ATPase
MNDFKEKVTLGRKCVVVLEFDIDQINEEIGRKSGKIKRLQTKAEDLIAQIKELKFKSRPPKKTNKTYEEMSNRELDEERARIEQIMTTKSLSKKEESELNHTLNKIARLKQDTSRPVDDWEQPDERNLERVRDLESEVSKVKELENKIKAERFSLFQ